MSDISTVTQDRAKLIQGNIKDFTVAKARELLGNEFSCISDQELQNLLDGLYKFCWNIIKHDSILHPKP